MPESDIGVHEVPHTILLLGTDASGKNHVARLIQRNLEAMNCDLVVREGWLCGAIATANHHGDKGGLSLLAERCFILLFPLIKWVLPLGMAVLLRWDAWRFKRSKQKTLVVSHNALRILAFYLGQNSRYLKSKTLPKWLEQAICCIQRVSNAMVIVLDVEDHTRQQRIQHRLNEGSIDPFDQFMANDSERSEQIEACLVHIATHYYQAHLIENNDLDDEALWAQFQKACQKG